MTQRFNVVQYLYTYSIPCYTQKWNWANTLLGLNFKVQQGIKINNAEQKCHNKTNNALMTIQVCLPTCQHKVSPLRL